MLELTERHVSRSLIQSTYGNWDSDRPYVRILKDPSIQDDVVNSIEVSDRRDVLSKSLIIVRPGCGLLQ